MVEILRAITNWCLWMIGGKQQGRPGRDADNIASDAADQPQFFVLFGTWFAIIIIRKLNCGCQYYDDHSRCLDNIHCPERRSVVDLARHRRITIKRPPYGRPSSRLLRSYHCVLTTLKISNANEFRLSRCSYAAVLVKLDFLVYLLGNTDDGG